MPGCLTILLFVLLFTTPGPAVATADAGLGRWAILAPFTDGYRTWVNGPDGVERRLNSRRFSWEANPRGLPVAP